jgi:ribosomal protein L11 methyltransferase
VSEVLRAEVRIEKGMVELLPPIVYDVAPNGFQIIEEKDSDVLLLYAWDRSALERLSSLPFVREIQIESQQVTDYARAAEESFGPIRICGMRIVAPWYRKRRAEDIVITPGMAFGTGRHESTKIMIRLMKGIEMRGRRVIDLGCGSGILSIFAKRLGARKVFAIDRDPHAILSARENMSLNGVREASLACVDIACLKGRFDVVLSNLDIETFREHAGKIGGLVDVPGTLVLSGILRESKREVCGLFPSFEMKRSVSIGEFCGIVLERSR